MRPGNILFYLRCAGVPPFQTNPLPRVAGRYFVLLKMRRGAAGVGEDRGEAEGGGAEEHGGQEGGGGLGQGRRSRAPYTAHGRRSRYPVNFIFFRRKPVNLKSFGKVQSRQRSIPLHLLDVNSVLG